MFAALLLIAGFAVGAALGWAVFSVRAVILSTVLFLVIAIVAGLDFNLSASTIALVLIAGTILLQTSYVVVVIVSSELKQANLPTPTPVNSRTWTLIRSRCD